MRKKISPNVAVIASPGLLGLVCVCFITGGGMAKHWLNKTAEVCRENTVEMQP